MSDAVVTQNLTSLLIFESLSFEDVSDLGEIAKSYLP